MELEPNRVLVVGAGKTGVAVARFCATRGAQVTLTDEREVAGLDLPGSVRLELGGHRIDSFLAADLIVVSPGVPRIREILAAQKKGVPITGEIELASRFVKAPIVGITGTNGKSTVTALCGEMARQTGRPTFVGGNLGTPLITAVGSEAAGPQGIVVVELSSFQLETCQTLHPRAAAILNLTPDHLDRYPSSAEYLAAKLRLFRNMSPRDAVVHGDDARLTEALRHLSPSRFAVARRQDTSGFVDGAGLSIRLPAGESESYPLDALRLVGRHNQLNALAALLLMRGSGLCNYDQALRALAAFRALPHRMELIGERRGVRFYDDSKATNVDSVVAGVDGFPAPFVLIAGGRDKGAPYAPMIAALQQNSCRAVLLIGEAASVMAAALDGKNLPHEHAASLEAAVGRATELARAGEAVVLSPACSSYDMFQNYEHRGRAFRAAVEALPA